MRVSEGESARPEGGEQDLDGLLTQVARGDQAAFEAVYDTLAGPMYGLINRVLRDPAQSEEVRPGGTARGVADRGALRSRQGHRCHLGDDHRPPPRR